MDKPPSHNYHIAIVAPLPEDYETAKASLDEIEPGYHLTNSGAACSLGTVGPHNVVLVGKAEDMTNVSVFVKDTVDDLLEAFPSIRAGFLIGVDTTTPSSSIAKACHVAVGMPQGFQPGLVQFDADKSSNSGRMSASFEMSHAPSFVKCIVEASMSNTGQQQWQKYLEDQLCMVEIANCNSFQQHIHDWGRESKVCCGRIASSARLLSDHILADKIGSDSKIICFERAAANILPRLPFLTICSIVGTTISSKVVSSVRHYARMAAVIYAMFVVQQISTIQLNKQHAFSWLFQYDQFGLGRPGFRLMRLEAGQASQLECHLFQAYLDDGDIIPYEALSYVWGAQYTPYSIKLDEKVISITTSLQAALYHLRKPNEDRILWVDALCIDQKNIRERGHQVSLMGEIYKKAENVIIWLGDLSADAVLLRSAIDKFTRQLPSKAFTEWSRIDSRFQDQWKQIEDSLGVSSHEKLVDSLQSLMENPWFTRVWILQEVANARRITVRCSQGRLAHKAFAIIPFAVGVQASEQCQAVLDIMPGPLKRSSWWNKNRNLCQLLWRFRGCQATDPRDRVYALLGMASDMETNAIQADYSKREPAVMREFLGYLSGKEWPAYESMASNIRELQSELPAISKNLLQKKLEDTLTIDSLEQFLGRQGSINMIDDKDILDIMEHGSGCMKILLDKSESPVQVSSDTALKFLRKFPDVLRDLLKRSNFTINSMPQFVAEGIEYNAEILGHVLESWPDPEQHQQLKDDAMMQAIQRGLPYCKAFLNQLQLSCQDNDKDGEESHGLPSRCRSVSSWISPISSSSAGQRLSRSDS
ncbi:hypothetical protein FOBRF1_006349 [Fusarium oxysporum]